MILSAILTPERIKVPLEGTTKEAVIEELVNVLDQDGCLTDSTSTLKAVLTRERSRTTGIGRGLAVPHGKSAGSPELAMAVGKTATPIDFASIDGKPVRMVMLVVSPMEKTGPHIRALARVSRIMGLDSFRRKLYKADSAEEIYDLILSQEWTSE